MKIGFVGLGAMGLGMAMNLYKAGLDITAYDRAADRRDEFARVGGVVADEVDVLLDGSFPVLSFCLAGGDMQKLCEDVLLEGVPAGTLIVDHGTLPAPRSRELHADFAQRGVNYRDVPISGGQGGAEKGELFLFVGAKADDHPELQSYFDAVGGAGKVFFAGEPGLGQVMKAVQNMSSWYIEAIRMEILAFGMHSGLDRERLLQATKEAEAGGPFTHLLDRIEQGNNHTMVNLNAEYDYFLEEAEANGFPMPAMRGLMDYLHKQDRDDVDVVNRPAHNTWKRFMTNGTGPRGSI